MRKSWGAVVKTRREWGTITSWGCCHQAGSVDIHFPEWLQRLWYGLRQFLLLPSPPHPRQHDPWSLVNAWNHRPYLRILCSVNTYKPMRKSIYGTRPSGRITANTTIACIKHYVNVAPSLCPPVFLPVLFAPFCARWSNAFMLNWIRHNT